MAQFVMNGSRKVGLEELCVQGMSTQDVESYNRVDGDRDRFGGVDVH